MTSAHPYPSQPPRPSLRRSPSGPRIAIVGGSLTGTATALMLLQAGFDQLTVFEAAPASAPAGRWADLAGKPRVGTARPARHRPIRVRDRPVATHRTDHPHGPLPDRVSAAGVTGRFTTWSLLHAALTARLPGPVIRRGARVTHLGTHGGEPLLTFADGDTAAAELVVFADGRNSTGRRLLDPDRRLRYTGYVAHRGTAPDIFARPTDFLRFQPGPGAQFNIAAVPGGADWTFYLNSSAAEYATLFGAPPQRRVFALPHHVSPAARQHVNAQATWLLPPEQAATVHVSAARAAVPILDIDPPTRMVWPVGTGHAVLLGDALAPVRPHTARGANNGIEQAAGLVTALLQHRRHHADLAGALNRWQRRHLPTVATTLRRGAVIAARLGLGQPAPQPTSADLAHRG